MLSLETVTIVIIVVVVVVTVLVLSLETVTIVIIVVVVVVAGIITDVVLVLFGVDSKQETLLPDGKNVLLHYNSSRHNFVPQLCTLINAQATTNVGGTCQLVCLQMAFLNRVAKYK